MEQITVGQAVLVPQRTVNKNVPLFRISLVKDIKEDQATVSLIENALATATGPKQVLEVLTANTTAPANLQPRRRVRVRVGNTLRPCLHAGPWQFAHEVTQTMTIWHRCMDGGACNRCGFALQFLASSITRSQHCCP